jgi:hypothetical protein
MLLPKIVKSSFGLLLDAICGCANEVGFSFAVNSSKDYIACGRFQNVVPYPSTNSRWEATEEHNEF